MARSVGKNFLWNAGYKLLLVLTPLITTPLVSRALGAEQVGVYSYTYSVEQYFAMFAVLGMAQHGVRAVAQAGNVRSVRSYTFWNAFMAQLCVAIPVAVIYGIYVALGATGGPLVGFIWSFSLLASVFDISWLFFGVEEFKVPTIRSALTKIVSVLTIILFVRGSEDLWIYCLSIAGADIANTILLWPFMRRYVDFVKPTWTETKKHFLPNLRLFAPVVAISFYTTLDKIMLGQISGMAQAGYYEYSEKLSKMPMSLITALGTVMLPHMTTKLAENKRKEAISLLGKCLWLMEAAAMCMTFGIAAITPEFVPVFFGEGYDPCIYIMPIISLVIPLISASNVIGVQYMLPTCSDNDYTVSVCAGAAVNVVLNLLLLPSFGAMGAAWATVAAELAVLLYQARCVSKDLPLMSYITDAAPFAVIGAIMYGIVRLYATLLTPVLGTGWVLLISEVLVGGIAYCVIAYIWSWYTNRLDDIKGALKRE